MAIDWVVDASICAKLLVPEPDSGAVSQLWEARIAEGRLLAPTLLRYEVGNVVARRAKGLGEAALRDALVGVEMVEPSDVLAYAGPLSYYDAAYLALAVERKTGLWTADLELRKAAKKHGIEVPP